VSEMNPGETDGVAVLDEPEPELELVPDDTPATPADGVQFLTSGKIRFVIEGAPYTLRNPRIGEFRRLHEMWVEGSKLPALEQLDHQLGWVKLLFNGDPEADPPVRGLSDHPLPDNPDEWPTWVGVATYQAKTMIHFRDVPLALGGPATG
jgi:hypothetical protein